MEEQLTGRENNRTEERGTEAHGTEERGAEAHGTEAHGMEERGMEAHGAEERGTGNNRAEEGGKDKKTIILQMDSGDEDTVDLLNVAGNMGKQKKAFGYLLAIAVCAGFLVAAAVTAIGWLTGTGSYARAVITFSFDGIDEGLGPNGGIFDVSRLKSTEVVDAALNSLGWEGMDIEAVRAGITIEGVIPDSVKQQIAVINTVSEDAAEYYTNIADLNYFPSQYTVTLKKCAGMSGSETRELLDAVLLAYREYFMDTYADTSVLGTAMSVLDIESYDYLQASDILANEIGTMQSYVDAKAEQAPDFRANSTGLSFSDLSSAIQAVERLDLNNFISFVQSNNLAKDAGTQIDYYNYQIREYGMELQELQNQLSNVEKTIAGYEKDPVIVMSSQESVTETEQKDEYYNTLLAQKLSLTAQIASLNTDINKAYAMVASLSGEGVQAQQQQQGNYDYADSLLSGLVETVGAWASLVQKTTEEYYEAELYASAYRISIPAQYSATGGTGRLLKLMAACGGGAALLVIVLWGINGLKAELIRMRKSTPELK